MKQPPARQTRSSLSSARENSASRATSPSRAGANELIREPGEEKVTEAGSAFGEPSGSSAR
jgi:hypothetical protein